MNSLVDKKKIIIPVILAGGVGSRLWPLSRELHPKPFIRLDDGQSLIQKTYLRAAGIGNVEEIITVTNRESFFYTKDEYNQVANRQINNIFLLEPFGRNSTGAIALAAHYAQAKYGSDSILLVMPADHLITEQAAFAMAVDQAVELAQQERLVTFGVKPDSPKTGYGYIEADGFNVQRFVEKPKREQAEKYLALGNYLWNSGMFCLQVGTILAEMHRHCPDIEETTFASFTNSHQSTSHNWTQLEIDAVSFADVRDISIDYSVFEKSDKVAVVPGDFGWSDIGSWLEFGQLHPDDANDNNIYGEVILENVNNCVIHSEQKLIAGIGLRDLIIADTQDALLIADKNSSQQVRDIVKTLKNKDHESYKNFPTVYRPWGSYTVLQEGEGFKLKRIEVKPGAALSLQSHKHRSEHWVVVVGIAKVTNGDDVFELEHNQSTYIPLGNKHRLENPGAQMLVLIEVQCGNYLGEDDIIRYQDNFGRK